MFRYLAALILVAALAASSSSGDARVVQPVADPAAAAGRRLLFGSIGCNECVAICQQVHYTTLCATMTTLPGVTTPLQLLDTALRITATKAAMTEVKLDQAMKLASGMGNAMSSSLESCKESYASLVDSLQTTRNTLKSDGSNADLMSELSAAGTYSTDCEDIFDERPELQSPIPGAQRHVSRLVSNCLDLAATIKQQP
ncbi:uncharacterized protein LOC133910040 [Phragmites australis]|uniref:uncharacterized protein LOC133910040 n=1 Tax=Phragmites australis TaxID=29695 RepID=UPI002D780421|nr:uncharacterized protein LOC133910040 [Phragmites australis]